MATWPGSLPDNFLVNTIAEAPPDNTVRTNMDVGPPKMRRRSTVAARPISGELHLTTAEVATLDTFFVSTLLDGADRFDWTHPRTGASVEFRFVSPPKYASNEGHWRVAIALELMP